MLWRIILLVCIPVLTVHASVPSRTKTFEDQKCQYTLPSEEWQWSENPPAKYALCAARNDVDGMLLMIIAIPNARVVALDERFVSEFDHGATRTEQVTKRGGHIKTFKGLPCYQLETMVGPETSSVVRVLLANKHCYQIQLFGGRDPVEKRTDFESIMNGFDFTTLPTATKPKNALESLAWIIGFIAVLVAITLLLKRHRGGQTPSRSTVAGLVCLFLSLLGFYNAFEDMMAGMFAGRGAGFVAGSLFVPTAFAVVGLFLLLKGQSKSALIPNADDASKLS